MSPATMTELDWAVVGVIALVPVVYAVVAFIVTRRRGASEPVTGSFRPVAADDRSLAAHHPPSRVSAAWNPVGAEAERMQWWRKGVCLADGEPSAWDRTPKRYVRRRDG